MNVKYKGIGRKSVAGLLLCLMGVLTACEDDFGKNGTNSGVLTMKVTVPEGWTSGVAVDEEAPDSRCVSVKELSCDGGTKLYLHTIVADNPVEETVSATRGTPITNLEEFKKKYTRFSLSGICYNGEYPSDESKNEWTTEYAHDLYFSTETGTQQIGEGRPPLVLPYNDKVKFFAFVPTMEDFEAMKIGGSLKMSSSGVKGSPTLTYTVPTDVEKQIDLMTASADYNFSSTSTQVPLKFGHALTAVRIACGKDMLAGTISKVKISGIYGSGTQVIGSNKWVTSGQPVSYTISKDIKLPTDDKSDDKVHAGTGTPITGTDKDNLTFILMPQTLPEDASITIEFTDAATNTERTITGSIAGHKWEAGTIITYSISPSSIHIEAEIAFDSNTIPYSGVWYEYAYKARINVTQKDVTKAIDIPTDKIQFQYKLEGGSATEWVNCAEKGLVIIPARNAYNTMKNTFSDRSEKGTETGPFSLPSEYGGETANCYLIDRPGYYSLPLVYGNGCTKPTSPINSFKYYPKHDEDEMPTDGKITGAVDAVLCWQDAPDLIDPTSVKVVDKDKLVFRIRERTLTQGNALLAVRNEAKEILWSWHIWVTPYKTDFYTESNLFETTTYMDMSTKRDKLRTYRMAKYHLGWCDSHATDNTPCTFSLQAVVDMSTYGGTKETLLNIPGTFTQMEYKGSDAGDNTYYQWGRKDPMLGGIYNDKTITYKYKKKGENYEENEFTMENKQVFNQYNQGGYNYSFCKNPGDKILPNDEASTGVTVGYSIKHPYMFITNSLCDDKGGDNPAPSFNYRNHWHKPTIGGATFGYLQGEQILFNAWDADATNFGICYDQSTGDKTIPADKKKEYLATNAANVKKTVYDPCPPKFKVPPIDAFREIYQASETPEEKSWNVTCNGKTITFQFTGVRNYALRTNEWETVVINKGEDPGFNVRDFYMISMPAFKNAILISSATLVYKDEKHFHQLMYFGYIGSKKYGISSNSYGLPVRPILDVKEPTN